MAQSSNHVYDKAKYHHESIEEFGLPLDHACNHTTFFLSWLVKSNLTSDLFESGENNPVHQYRQGKMSINDLYAYWDCCLSSDMLNDAGNAFARDYFDFHNGHYLYDYEKYLLRDLPSTFHVPYTEENEKIIHAVFDKRYKDWVRRQDPEHINAVNAAIKKLHQNNAAKKKKTLFKKHLIWVILLILLYNIYSKLADAFFFWITP